MVEGGGLENRFPVLRNGGSNPSPSATVAFLRGIDNCGSRRVTMAALKSALESMGFLNVKTVLACGNVVFEPARRDPRLAEAIERTPDLMRYMDRARGPRGATRNWRTATRLVGEAA